MHTFQKRVVQAERSPPTSPLAATGEMKEMKQVNPITARLRDILRNYSSAQLLNELLQNADDAGSTEFKVLLDGRTGAFRTKALLSPALAEMQGPALYQFDDAVFDPDDYESIQRVGDGIKMGDPTKTGQFGLGFNSVCRRALSLSGSAKFETLANGVRSTTSRTRPCSYPAPTLSSLIRTRPTWVGTGLRGCRRASPRSPPAAPTRWSRFEASSAARPRRDARRLNFDIRVRAERAAILISNA